MVTSRLGENLTYIEDGRSGVLTTPGDIEDLARALLTVLTEPGWAVELGHNARQRVWAYFDWDGRVDEVVRSYQIALEHRGRR